MATFDGIDLLYRATLQPALGGVSGVERDAYEVPAVVLYRILKD